MPKIVFWIHYCLPCLKLCFGSITAYWDQEPSTPAARGMPWKGRLRSHHTISESLPMQSPLSGAKNQEETAEVQTSRKQVAPKRMRSGCKAGAALQSRATRQSLRLAGRDPDHPIVIDKGYNVRDNRLAMIPLRRSPRLRSEDKNLGKPLLPQFHQETSHIRKTINALRKNKDQDNLGGNMRNAHNRKTQNALMKGKNQENLKRSRGKAGLKPLARMKSQNKPQVLCQDSQDIPPSKKIADVSRKKSEKQELKLSHCEVLTGKRKRGTEGRASSKKQIYLEPKSLPADCQDIVPFNIEKNPSTMVKPKIGDKRLINNDGNNKEQIGTERVEIEHLCGSDDWTDEQDMALRRAYFSARPSPHFWKRVSKMVQGRSAEECFNRIHAELSTPTPIAPRPRRSKMSFSPLGKFTLSDPKLPNILKPTVGRQRTAKQKSLAAQKTVRHLLQKHSLIDQAQEADHFSIFETSPSALQLNISFQDSPETSDSYMNSDSLHKCGVSSSARKKPFSRLKTMQPEPSPPVLKPVKNVILHEKYIDQLSRREGTKRPRKRTPGSKAADSGKTRSEQQGHGLKAAKNALISEATDFISRFKKLQANSHMRIVETSEDDEIDGKEYDASDDKE